MQQKRQLFLLYFQKVRNLTGIGEKELYLGMEPNKAIVIKQEEIIKILEGLTPAERIAIIAEISVKYKLDEWYKDNKGQWVKMPGTIGYDEYKDKCYL